MIADGSEDGAREARVRARGAGPGRPSSNRHRAAAPRSRVWQGTGVRWLLLLLLIPVIDLYLLVQAGQMWGGLAVAAFVIASALVGRWLARRHSRRLFAVMGGERVAAGQVPDLASGAAFGLSGVLLMIPGPLSSVLGLLLMARPVRRGVSRFVAGWLERRMAAFSAAAMQGMPVDLGAAPRGSAPQGSAPRGPAPGSRGAVIDVEAVEVLEVPAERKPS